MSDYNKFNKGKNRKEVISTKNRNANFVLSTGNLGKPQITIQAPTLLSEDNVIVMRD